MAGTITFGGIGSGMDTEAIVSGLVQASRGPLSLMTQRKTATESAVASLSNLGSLLSTLKSTVSELATASQVASHKVTSSSAAVVASANGTAQPGAYSIEVTELAREQRTYTNTQASSTTALGQSGQLSLQIGSATPLQVSVVAGDSLENVAGKINALGARVSASIFYDGTTYRMQVRGLDTGASNAITFGESGTTFGLTTPANTVQTAKDAQLKIDGFTVTRPTNQVAGALQGVTLALTEKTTSPITLRVEPSESQLSGKLQAVVDAYNAVVRKVQTTAGNGSIKAQEKALAGDSTLRGLTSRMSNAVLTQTGSGNISTLGSVGLTLNRDGTMSLNATKLSQALAADSSAVSKVLAGTDSSDGVMDLLASVADVYNQTGTGLLALKKDSLTTRAQSLGKQLDRENERLDRYADALRKQFTSMDGSVAANRSDLDYLTSLYSG